eukprot:TRINITY_DN37979_c0_g1_i1.p1 TRINITY_DN37979_c0_g1~~TRINITY_DN37979_c0_g1_i1.p1  ORF type:complete len:248 (+),score=47.37 TRINITY_DN37979_c0_g1_i1:49-744(+)
MFRISKILRYSGLDGFYSANASVAGVSVPTDDVHHTTGKLMGLIYEKPEFDYCYLAGGDFWGLEASVLSEERGIQITKCGFLGNHDGNHSSFTDVCLRNNNQIIEGVKVVWSTSELDLLPILWRFWGSHNPTILRGAVKGQRKVGSAIWCSSADQLAKVTEARNCLQTALKKTILTSVNLIDEFTEDDLFKIAEPHHQQRYHREEQFTRRSSKRLPNYPSRSKFIDLCKAA